MLDPARKVSRFVEKTTRKSDTGAGKLVGGRAAYVLDRRPLYTRRVIRRARPEDSQGIALVHVRGWQAAYASVLRAEALAQLSVEQRASTWREHVAAGETILVAEQDGVVEGFAAVGLAREEDSERVGELYAIYVEPDLWGRGLGRKLIGAAEDALRGSGFCETILWVLEDNPRARRFYEASGWQADRARRIEVLGTDVAEVRYRKRL